MTRINSGIDPRRLPMKQLIAEHNEILRLPGAITSGKAVVKDIPKEFSLGKGHVKFFYDKQLYLLKRYRQLYREGLRRGYKMNNFEHCWDDVPDELMNDYTPTNRDRVIILERLWSRNVYLLPKEK